MNRMDSAIGLLFHGIGTPARDLEPGEAPYWISAERFENILDQVLLLPDPDRIRISFDDGNASDHEIALPRLLERRLRADFFVLSGRIGQTGSLSAIQIRDLVAAGMGVGSHGIAHRNWCKISAEDLEEELSLSRQAIESVVGHAVRTAGIPFGSYDARVLSALQRAGYAAAYSSDRGPMDLRAFLRPRTSVTAGMTQADIDSILAGRLSRPRRLRRAVGMFRRRWF
jgi:peptidoglycan/xylan/chitin deacetylase (PgdA/CDA1 family)